MKIIQIVINPTEGDWVKIGKYKYIFTSWYGSMKDTKTDKYVEIGKYYFKSADNLFQWIESVEDRPILTDGYVEINEPYWGLFDKWVGRHCKNIVLPDNEDVECDFTSVHNLVW